MTGDTSFDERKALLLLSEGSEFAFIQLFDRYRPAIFRSATRFLDSREQAEEIVQEVFMEVWQRRATITKIVNFQSYLLAMVRNQVYDNYQEQTEIRDLKRELMHGERQVMRGGRKESDADADIRDKEYQELFREAVDQLPEIQREVFQLARNEDLSQKEIAERLDLSHLAVKAHMFRALKTLRERLEPYFGTGVIMIVFQRMFDNI